MLNIFKISIFTAADSSSDISQSVDEVWPLVSQFLNFSLRLAFNPVVSLATPPLRILPPEEEILHHATTEQEQGFITQYNSVAGLETWRIFRSIDV